MSNMVWINAEEEAKIHKLGCAAAQEETTVTAIVFIGEFLQVLSRNYYRATVHRVKGQQSGGSAVVGSMPRFSCPFIIRGRNDAVINLRDESLYAHSHPSFNLRAPSAAAAAATTAEVGRGLTEEDEDEEDPRLPHMADLDGTTMKMLHKMLDLKRRKRLEEHDRFMGMGGEDNWVLSAFPLLPFPPSLPPQERPVSVISLQNSANLLPPHTTP